MKNGWEDALADIIGSIAVSSVPAEIEEGTGPDFSTRLDFEPHRTGASGRRTRRVSSPFSISPLRLGTDRSFSSAAKSYVGQAVYPSIGMLLSNTSSKRLGDPLKKAVSLNSSRFSDRSSLS